jgi:hypothetical protein
LEYDQYCVQRSGCIEAAFAASRGFGGPNKKMHSISRAEKLWVEACAGMSEANDLGNRNHGTPKARNADRPVETVDLIPKVT